MANLILFLVSSLMLFFVLRFRVHIHILYQRPQRKPIENYPGPANGKRPVHLEAAPQAVSDLTSALHNLGCGAAKARQIAERVYQQAPQANFTVLLKQAIREAA
jgi:hypothetical protein